VINLLLGNLSTLVERKLRTRRGGPVVEIEVGAQTDLMAARQEILVLDEPGSASVMPQQERGFDSRP